MQVTIKITDAHVHWWDLETNYYPWLSDQVSEEGGRSGVGSIASNYLLENFIVDANRAVVEAVVHIEAGFDPAQPALETQWLENEIERTSNSPAVAIIGSANLSHSNVEVLLERHASYPHVRGIRHMLNYTEGDPNYCWADQEYLKNFGWLNNFALLDKYELRFDLMCFAHQMADAADLAKRNPNTQIILEHSGMPTYDTDALKHWQAGINLLAECDNVSCKLGGLGTMIPSWGLVEMEYVMDVLLHAFGPNRLMFSSNFPTDKMFCPYDHVLGQIVKNLAQLSESEQDAIMRTNARKIYGF